MSRVHVPVVRQLESVECGAACIASLLRYYGCPVTLSECREAAGVSRAGTSGADIMRGLERLGVDAKGVQLDITQIGKWRAPAIIHWRFRHWVVYEGIKGGRIYIMDPAMGRRVLDMDEMRRSFTGVAIRIDTLKPASRPARPPVHWQRYWDVLRPNAASLAAVFVASLILQAAALTYPAFMLLVVDMAMRTSAASQMWYFGVGALSLLLVQGCIDMLRMVLIANLRTKLDVQMMTNFMSHLLRLPYEFFQRRTTGDLVGRLSSNTSLRDIMSSDLLALLLDVLLMVTSLLVMLPLSFRLTCIVVLAAVIIIAIMLVSHAVMNDLVMATLHVERQTYSVLIETIRNILSLKSSGNEESARRKWHAYFMDELRAVASRSRLEAIVRTATQSAYSVAPVIVLWAGMIETSNGRLTLGKVLALSTMTGMFLGPITRLSASVQQILLARQHVELIEDVLSSPVEQAGLDALPSAPLLTGDITLNDVCFRYGPMDELALNHVNLAIGHGEMVALVGRSGSGKSTLAKLMAGIYLPEAGAIRYDGCDAMSVNLGTLRRQLGVVVQDAVMTNASIHDNITEGRVDVTMDDVEWAAEVAAINDEIMAMPAKYETLMGEGGGNFSGGQRQRVALARALCRRPSVLIIDEGTSALDAITEETVMRNLASLNCTRIVIAHRLSTISCADKIVVMENGRIIETGSHMELLMNGGYYARLVAAQLTPDVYREQTKTIVKQEWLREEARRTVAKPLPKAPPKAASNSGLFKMLHGDTAKIQRVIRQMKKS